MPQPATSAQVSNSAFLRALAQAAPKGSHLWVTSFAGSPDLTDAGNWAGGPYSPATQAERVDGWGALNSYFCPSALWVTAEGSVKRRKSNFRRLLALVADDADTDAVLGTPSWVLETSPGKRQVGFFIDRDCEDAGNSGLCERVINEMAQRGLVRVDSAGNNIVRYVRLPLGSNLKPRESGPWACQLTTWNPQASYTLADAAASFGVDLDGLRSDPSPASAGASIPSSGPQDERLRVLTANLLRGESLHDSTNQIAASLVASGMAGGAIVNLLRALLEASLAAKDERWAARYADIPRAVSTAESKFKPKQVNPDDAPPDPEAEAVNDADSPLPLVFSEDIDLSAINMAQIVEDTLTVGGLSVMYGESNSGKSFMACDMDCHIAAGMSWQGKRVTQGAVLYVAGEGAESIKLRVLAWSRHHGVCPNIAIIPVAVDLLHPEVDVMRIVAAALEVEKHYGMPVIKITVDTLARAIAGGNENAPEDMGAIVANCDRLRMLIKAHVMLLHHQGKDAAKGARGHSSLRAATDTEIEVSGEEVTKLHTAHITKQRDLNSRGQQLTVKFAVIEMGVDQWGKPMTTCIVEPTTETPATEPSQKKGSDLRSALIATLSAASSQTLRKAALVTALKAAGFTNGPIYRAIEQIVASGQAMEMNGLVHLARPA